MSSQSHDQAQQPTYDVVVIGGGPVGLSTAYEVAKAGKSVAVLEKNNFFNHAGSSGDLVRMFRTMYTECYMAQLAYDAMGMWDDLERDCGDSLRLMSGLLNFGDPDYGEGGPEGMFITLSSTLKGPKDNLQERGMAFKEYTKDQIEERYPFINLPENWQGLYAPDNGCINVPQLCRSLYRLAQDYGAHTHQYVSVTKIKPIKKDDRQLWEVTGTKHGSSDISYIADKIVIACGAYVNDVVYPSFHFHLNLIIWEMVATYFSMNAGPKGTILRSMWFHFAKDDARRRSQLFYGFPALPWGPPNVARIAVDAATNHINDPKKRKNSVINADDIDDTRQFIQKHVVGVDPTVPAFSLSCLQTNVFDNMFVLDFIPEEFLHGGAKDSVAIFTAGWAMKFVPLLGIALKDMVLKGDSKYKMKEFSILRKNEDGTKTVISPGPVPDEESPMTDQRDLSTTATGPQQQAAGSSMRATASVAG
ncbi:hypothetical protein MMC18_006153 [Xylographa bjoerkii]|nr:hypothetical protein [Xylographa bjoerkii]